MSRILARRRWRSSPSRSDAEPHQTRTRAHDRVEARRARDRHLLSTSTIMTALRYARRSYASRSPLTSTSDGSRRYELFETRKTRLDVPISPQELRDITNKPIDVRSSSHATLRIIPIRTLGSGRQPSRRQPLHMELLHQSRCASFCHPRIRTTRVDIGALL